MSDSFESDWKLLQKSIGDYNEKLHRELLAVINSITNDEQVNSRERIMKISRAISRAEKEMNASLYRISRSRLLEIIMFYHGKGVMGNDLEKYSPITVNKVMFLMHGPEPEPRSVSGIDSVG